MQTKVLTLVLICCTLVGCLRENYAEKEQVLSVPEDHSSLTLEAETLGEGNVYDTVVTQLVNIRANRSWSAVIEYEGDEAEWLDLSVDEFLNLHEYSVDEPITLIAQRNKSNNSRRAKIVVSSDSEHVITIPVEQKAQQPFIEVEAERSEVLSIGEEVAVNIKCNTQWTAALDQERTTAGVKLSATEGTDYAVITAAIEENFSAVEGKIAVIQLSAQGVDTPKELVITQKEGKPYIEFRMSETVLSPEASQVMLNFGSSVNWSLRVKETDGIEGATFSQSTGGPTSTGDVVMSFDVNGEDPGANKSITVELSANGLESVEHTFTQKGCIHLDFLDVTAPESDKPYSFHWPFADPVQKGFPASASTGTYRGQTLDLTTPGGHVFTAISVDWGTSGGIWYNAVKQGFQVGSGKGSCLVFPAVEGMTLKKVIYEPPYLLKSKCYISDEAGNIITGGELWESNGGGANIVTHEMMENHVYELSGTQPGVRYRIVANNAGVSVSFKDLVLIYE